MDDSVLVAKFLDRLDYGMVDVCIEGVTCGGVLYWVDQHFEQGFAWQQGLVGFLVPDNYGTIEVSIWCGVAVLRPDTIRAIRLPFTMPENSGIQVTCGWGLSDDPKPMHPIPAGVYALHFSVGHDPTLETAEDREAYLRGFWCDLIFVPADATEPAVIKADDLLSPKYPLLMQAGPDTLTVPELL